MNPISINERLPEPKDLNANGDCWVFSCFPGGGGSWLLNSAEHYTPERREVFKVSHWLPYHALPNPNENDLQFNQFIQILQEFK